MKTKKKAKAHASQTKHHTAKSRPIGTQHTHVVSRSRSRQDRELETFTPMETGQPDQDAVPDGINPAGVQGGRGPLNQEGEGNRQNDELAELESIEPGNEIR